MEEEVSPGTRLTATAEAQVDKLIEGAVLTRKQQDTLKHQVRNLRVAIAVLCLLVLGLGFVGWQNHENQVASCRNGNNYRAGVVASLDRLVVLLEGPHPTPAIKDAAVEYDAYVLAHNAPRDCDAISFFGG